MQSAVPAAADRPRPSRQEETDQHVILRGMTWKDYEILLAVRGDRSGVRMYYLNGAIELMSPTISHEGIKTTLGRLLEAYCDERGIDLSGYGSWTLRNAFVERGAEPDECYVVGKGATMRDAAQEMPDLAIEVVWSHGGLDKLEIYRGLGVAEVWMWDREHGLRVFALREAGYEPASRSRFFADLDPAWLASFLDQPTQSAAVRALRAAMR